jgi:hypothetical protein
MNDDNDNIQKIIHLMQTDDSVDAPNDAIKWSKNLFRTKAAEHERGILKRIVGVLLQQLDPGTAAVGERSGTAGNMRQMLFEAGDNRVDLRVKQVAGVFEVRGQILGRGSDQAVINFAGEEKTLDKFGGFIFADINTGDYEMTIRTLESEIVLKGIVLE